MFHMRVTKYDRIRDFLKCTIFYNTYAKINLILQQFSNYVYFSEGIGILIVAIGKQIF